MRLTRVVARASLALIMALAWSSESTMAQPAALLGIELGTPPGEFEGALIDEAVFRQGGTVVGVFRGILAVSSNSAVEGSSALARITARGVPDAVEVTFAVPIDGLPTVYSVSPPDFAFDVQYFLPDPSPGGTIPPQPGDPATHAWFRLSVTTIEPPEERQPPDCNSDSSAPGFIEVTVQDLESGLAEIEVRRSRNLTLAVPDFDPGTNDPVVIVASIDDPNRTAILLIKAIDEADNVAYCKIIQRRKTRSRR